MKSFVPRKRRLQTPEQRAQGGHGRAPKNPDPAACLYVVFDLSCVAIDFGIIEYIVLGTHEAIERGLGQVHFVFVPAANDSFRIHGAPDFIPDEWRIQNILMQAPWLSSLCVGMTWCNTREQADKLLTSLGGPIFPDKYDIRDGDQGYVSADASRRIIHDCGKDDFRLIQATASSKHYVQRWMDRYVGDRLAVTISLREGNRDDVRNSHTGEWVKFAKSLDPDVYCPIFIRDTETLFGGDASGDRANNGGDGIDDFLSFSEASLNLHARCALYELSYVNLGVNLGPVAMCIYSKTARYLVFRYCVEGAYSTTEDYLNWIGLERGKSYPYAGPTQKIVWEEDNLDIIKREFDQLVAYLSA